MPRTPPLPEKCSKTRINRDTEVARGEFRARRLEDPLREYAAIYPSAKAAADAVISALNVILTLPTDKAIISGLVGNKASFSALRSLAATPISADDLNTLLRAKVNKTALKANQALADNLSELITVSLDPTRFPWVAASRPATPAELEAAKLATAVLTTVNAVLASRRGDERKDLEGRVNEILNANGFVQVRKPAGGISLPAHFPSPGQYMKSCKLGDHNADFVIALLDGRILAIECKASNSEVNGYKRLNKEVVADAADWMNRFGVNVGFPRFPGHIQ